MAAIAEDEQVQVRDFLEQQRLLEEERLQQEEAARLLAEQDALAQQQQIQDAPPAPEIPFITDPEPSGLRMPAPVPENYMNQPQGEIDAIQAQFNQQAQPTAFAPAVREAYTPDSAQYQAEVARAQRGSGFIAADVGPGGNVITAGYDPEKDPRAIVARREATNLQRNQYIDSLMKGGATYAEAMRSAMGRHPMAGDDALRQKVESLALKQRPQSLVTQVRDGVTYYQTPSGGWAPTRAAAASKPIKIVPGAIPQNVKTEQTRLFKDADRAKALLDKGTEDFWDEKDGKTIKTPLSAARKLALQRTVDDLELKARELVAPSGRLRPEYNPKVDQPGWEAMRDRFNAPPKAQQPTAQEKELTADLAREFLKSAGGDKDKARKLAREAGYKL